MAGHATEVFPRRTANAVKLPQRRSMPASRVLGCRAPSITDDGGGLQAQLSTLLEHVADLSASMESQRSSIALGQFQTGAIMEQLDRMETVQRNQGELLRQLDPRTAPTNLSRSHLSSGVLPSFQILSRLGRRCPGERFATEPDLAMERREANQASSSQGGFNMALVAEVGRAPTTPSAASRSRSLSCG